MQIETHTKAQRHEEEIANNVIGTAIDIHKNLGPGLLESVYETILFDQLRERGIDVQRQVSLPISYKEKTYQEFFKIDLLVESQIILELKSVEKLQPVHAKQLLTYLKLSKLRLGLLLNFGESLLKDGIKRVLNG